MKHMTLEPKYKQARIKQGLDPEPRDTKGKIVREFTLPLSKETKKYLKRVLKRNNGIRK